jgi:hypothetical protein
MYFTISIESFEISDDRDIKTERLSNNISETFSDPRSLPKNIYGTIKFGDIFKFSQFRKEKYVFIHLFIKQKLQCFSIEQWHTSKDKSVRIISLSL